MAEQSHFMTFGGKQVYSPAAALAHCRAQSRPTSWYGLPNRFVLSRGFEPGFGWLLMTKKDLDALPTSFTIPLKFHVGPKGNVALQVENLGVWSAEAILAGAVEDDKALYLVAIADKRIIAYGSPLGRGYNILGRGKEVTMEASGNLGVDWTWAEMVEDIWTPSISALLGPLDVSRAVFPSSVPTQFAFEGTSAWTALQGVADSIDHNYIRTRGGINYFQDSGYNDDSTYTSIHNAALRENKVIHTSHERNPNYTRIPSSFRVYFPKQDYAFQNGSYYTDLYPGDYWVSRNTVNYVVNTSAIDATVTGTTADFEYPLYAPTNPGIYTQDGVLFNGAELSAAATVLATRALKGLLKSDRTLYGVYSGIHDFETGSRLAAVAWGDTDGTGLRTEIIGTPRKLSFQKDRRPGASLPLKDIATTLSSEWPSKADLSRWQPPAERFVVGVMLEDIKPCEDPADAFGLVQVLYGIGTDPLEWRNSQATHQFNAYLLSRLEVLRGNKVICMYHVQAGRWIILSFWPDACGSGSGSSGSDGSGSSGSDDSGSGSDGSGSDSGSDGSGSGPCYAIPGLSLSSLPEVEDDEVAFVLVETTSGCLAKLRVTSCDGSGSGS